MVFMIAYVLCQSFNLKKEALFRATKHLEGLAYIWFLHILLIV